MKIDRKFTQAGRDAYASIAFRQATSEIRNPDGSIIFRLEDFDVPEAWSQVAADVLAQKYFRKAGVPARLRNTGPTESTGPDRATVTSTSRRASSPARSRPTSIRSRMPASSSRSPTTS